MRIVNGNSSGNFFNFFGSTSNVISVLYARLWKAGTEVAGAALIPEGDNGIIVSHHENDFLTIASRKNLSEI
jgi:hypothetical protein